MNEPGEDAPVITADPVHRGRITARDPQTGEVRWSAVLPARSRAGQETPMATAGDLAIVPVGDGGHVAALDLASGRIRWEADGGSPGRDRRYSERGWIDDVVRSPDGDTIVVAVAAARPVHD